MIKGFLYMLVVCYFLGQILGAILGLLPFWPFTGDQIATALLFPGAVIYLVYAMKKLERGEPITKKKGPGWGWVIALGVMQGLSDYGKDRRRRKGRW